MSCPRTAEQLHKEGMACPTFIAVICKALPRAPGWMMGLALVLIALFSGAATALVVLTPGVEKWIVTRGQIEAGKNAAKSEENKTFYDTITAVVSQYSAEVIELSKTVGRLQQDNQTLQYEVESVKRDVSAIKSEQQECLSDLSKCQKGKKV